MRWWYCLLQICNCLLCFHFDTFFPPTLSLSTLISTSLPSLLYIVLKLNSGFRFRILSLSALTMANPGQRRRSSPSTSRSSASHSRSRSRSFSSSSSPSRSVSSRSRSPPPQTRKRSLSLFPFWVLTPCILHNVCVETVGGVGAFVKLWFSTHNLSLGWAAWLALNSNFLCNDKGLVCWGEGYPYRNPYILIWFWYWELRLSVLLCSLDLLPFDIVLLYV